MIENKHRLIADLSVEYADRMSEGDDNATFSCGDIAAAYIIGAEKTLRRVCNVIHESANVGGLSQDQAKTLLDIIETIECMPKIKSHE